MGEHVVHKWRTYSLTRTRCGLLTVGYGGDAVAVRRRLHKGERWCRRCVRYVICGMCADKRLADKAPLCCGTPFCQDKDCYEQHVRRANAGEYPDAY